MPDIADTGLSICSIILDNESNNPEFLCQYLLQWMQDLFFVLTDSEHKAGFPLQCKVLCQVFALLRVNEVVFSGEAPLEYIKKFVSVSFSHLMAEQVDNFSRGLLELNGDLNTFKLHLRDFLIQLKEFSSEDPELWMEERQLMNSRKEKALSSC